MSINNILIIGFGRMGQWFADQLSNNYNITILEKFEPKNNTILRYQSIEDFNEIKSVKPDLIINAVNINATIEVFDCTLDYLPKEVIRADIMSIKSGIKKYYKKTGIRFASTHPMFGPTFGNMNNLKNENAIIIEESDEEGKEFFGKFYSSLGLKLHYTHFDHHDEMMSESLSLPFIASLLFIENATKCKIPGTTYEKHQKIAEGILSEDENLLSEVLFNSHSLKQIKNIENSLKAIHEAIVTKDQAAIKSFLSKLKDSSGIEEILKERSYSW